MKRSHSLVAVQRTVKYSRSLTFQDSSTCTVLNAQSSMMWPGSISTKSNRSKDNFLVSPISLTSTGQKPSSKILTSDFWSNEMKLKLLKRTERLKLNVISEKLIISTPSYPKLEKIQTNQGKILSTRLIKLQGVSKIGFIDKIIDQCKNETANNRKLGHEFFHMRKTVTKSFNNLQKIAE